MDSATDKRACIAAAAFLFCLSLGLTAREQKPLLKVHESINSAFAIGTQHRSLQVSQDGRISLKWNIGRGSKAILSAAELQALRSFLNSGRVQYLQDSYADRTFFLDYHGSMEIEMTPDGKTKRIALPDLSF